MCLGLICPFPPPPQVLCSHGYLELCMADAKVGRQFRQAAMQRAAGGVTAMAWGGGSDRWPLPLKRVVLV